MNRTIIIGLIVLALGLLVGWFVLQGGMPDVGQTPNPTPTPEATDSSSLVPGDFPIEATAGGQIMEKGGIPVTTEVVPSQAPVATSTVHYTDTGFAPITISVKVGTTVRFTNQSGLEMWVASAVHPTHQLLPGFDQAKSVSKGGSYDYTFASVGTWKYHNHQNPTDEGTVIVTR